MSWLCQRVRWIKTAPPRTVSVARLCCSSAAALPPNHLTHAPSPLNAVQVERRGTMRGGFHDTSRSKIQAMKEIKVGRCFKSGWALFIHDMMATGYERYDPGHEGDQGGTVFKSRWGAVHERHDPGQGVREINGRPATRGPSQGFSLHAQPLPHSSIPPVALAAPWQDLRGKLSDHHESLFQSISLHLNRCPNPPVALAPL